MKPITLRLGEDNELKFKLQIQGITSNPQETKPRIRFLVTEKGIEDNGILLPAVKDKEGFVVINFSGDSKLFDSEKLYEGNIEVLIGNRFFNAAKYELSFMKEMKVEVESVVVNNKNFITEDAAKEEIEVSTELVNSPSDRIDESFAKEFGTKLPKQSLREENEVKQKQNEIKSKVRKALAEKLKLQLSDPKLEKLVESAYKKYQNQVKD